MSNGQQKGSNGGQDRVISWRKVMKQVKQADSKQTFEILEHHYKVLYDTYNKVVDDTEDLQLKFDELVVQNDKVKAEVVKQKALADKENLPSTSKDVLDTATEEGVAAEELEITVPKAKKRRSNTWTGRRQKAKPLSTMQPSVSLNYKSASGSATSKKKMSKRSQEKRVVASKASSVVACDGGKKQEEVVEGVPSTSSS